MVRLMRVFAWLSMRTGVYLWWSRVYRGVSERNYRGIVLPKFTSMEELEEVVGAMRWRRDTWRMAWDAVSDPRATWGRHIRGEPAGDCEDISLFAADRVEDMITRGEISATIRVRLLSVAWYDRRAGRIGGHSVCAMSYPWGDFIRWCHLSNWYSGVTRYGHTGCAPMFIKEEDVVYDVLRARGLDRRDLAGFLLSTVGLRAERFGTWRDVIPEDDPLGLDDWTVP